MASPPEPKDSIVIPLRSARGDCIEVFHHELPEDPTDVIDMLRTELAPLDTWCDFAIVYHRQGRREQFRK